MKLLKLSALVLCGVLMLGASSYQMTDNEVTPTANAQTSQSFKKSDGWTNEITASAETNAVVRYRLDASRSRFVAQTYSGGLLWFLGHGHLVGVRSFTGEVQLTPDAINPASLQMTVRADSLAETSDVFTELQKQIINKELREIVLEPAKYPEIVFKSTDMTGKLAGGQFKAKIGGDLTLHGVTRHIVIPTQVTLNGDTLRARGEFTVKRSDFNVKATSAKHGLIRVRDKLKFTFDIMAQKE